MKVVGVIPTRYQSSRFPGKPLALICGRPMLWWVYQQCRKVLGLDETYVATDSDRVAEAASRIEGDVFINIQGDALYFSRSVIPSNVKDGRLAKVYRHVGIYGYRRDALLLFHSWKQPDIELREGIEPLRAMYHGCKVRVAETAYSSIGVDYPEHIAKVEQFIRERGKNSYEPCKIT